MSSVLRVLGIAGLAAAITGVGAVLGELLTLSNRVVSGALQLAAGVLVAIVFVDLLPPAVRGLALGRVVLVFFLGSALFVLFDYASAWHTGRHGRGEPATGSASLFVGIVGDFLIDAVVIGIGAALDLGTGLLLAVGMAIAQAPLAFVAIATAKAQGMPTGRRRSLIMVFFAIIAVGVLLGYLVLKNQPETVILTLVAASGGFLITAAAEVMVPDAIGFLERKGPSLTPIWFTLGLTGMSLFKLTGK
ncbi:ZIP family metal transporter [Actinopolymorpha rutila]|uniref:ZIP family zinc transporter n=1 Tax=Actinopolymorpha rutila TaxID=446787 RepID=A0A852ZJZ2_9ACTN|nr:hypothetical protein [Actinopolymorpha rutila]NYH93304.1 ZIP family zinc transporter [Actinopolymorpha rutila]